MSAERRVGLVILAIVGVYVYLIIQLPAQRMPDDVGEALVPWLIAGLCILLCGVLVLSPKSSASSSEQATNKHCEDGSSSRRSMVCVGAMGAYIFLLPYAGFFISTSLFAVGLMRYSGSRQTWRDVAIAIVATAVIHLTFTRLLLVPLPEGSWFDGLEW